MATVVRLFVGGLPPDVAEADLRGRFSPFGDVSAVDVRPPKEAAGDLQKEASCRGYAHLDVAFTDERARS